MTSWITGSQAVPVSPAIQAPTHLRAYFGLLVLSPGRSVRCTLHRLAETYSLKQRPPIHPLCCANLLVSYASQFFNVAVFSTLPTFQHSAQGIQWHLIWLAFNGLCLFCCWVMLGERVIIKFRLTRKH